MDLFETRLVEAVKRKREAQGLSIRALSGEVGISFSTLARIERGEGQPDNNSRIRLIEWLGEDAQSAGIGFNQVAFVHFRAMKNVRSPTVRRLLDAANCIKREFAPNLNMTEAQPELVASYEPMSLSKAELEDIAERFRFDLGIDQHKPIDPLFVEVEGVRVVRLKQTSCIDQDTISFLAGSAGSEWSAMSVPLDPVKEQWLVLLNDSHVVERQRVTLLEEYWHILLGHKLTKVAKVAESYGRTYDKAEEHDAYYLAAATLLPKKAVVEAVRRKLSGSEIARHFGTSLELVDYRIKRLGLWRDYVGRRISLNIKS